MAATFLVGVMTAVIMPLALVGSPASAADPEQFSLGLVEGELLLRGAEEPYALTNPTSISGTNTDGALTGVNFSTPVVKTERAVPEYNTTAKIDAAFSMVQPGVGTINTNGDITVQLKLAVDLHIVVGILPGSSDCHAEPVNLTLTSTAAYDEETNRVELRAPNFSVPPIAGSAQCNALLVEPVNEALAGPGHSIALTLEGDITIPELGEDTVTDLEASPAGSSDLGEDVTLTATVTPDPGNDVTPEAPITGLVNFLSDGSSIGTAEVQEDGTATLTTDAIPAGPRQLTAEYSGASPDWKPSSSDAVAHSVIAPPLVSTTAAGEVRIGGDPKDFSVTVNNTGFGADLEDARLEVTVRRSQGFSPLTGVTLSRVVNNVATPITMTSAPFPPSLSGEVGDTTTWEIPAGAEHTENLRLQVPNGVDPGPLAVDFALVTGAGPEVTLASTSGAIAMVTAARLPSTIDSGVAGFPPFIPDGVPITPRVRQGNVAEMESLRISSTVGGVNATGLWHITIDGVPVQAQHADLQQPGAFQWLNAVPVSNLSPRVLLRVPRSIPAGVHQVTVRYSGDSVYAPAQRSWPITVEEAIGTVYECVSSSVTPVRFTANVEVEASLPSVWAVGQTLPVDRVQVRMRISRTAAQESLANDVDEGGKDWRLELAPDGTIVPTTLTDSDAAVMVPDDPGPTDHLISFNDGTGEITVDPVPGTVDDYTLDSINITATPGGFNTGFLCEPSDEPPAIGTITSAGTTLTASTAGPVGAGTPVTLTASALPAAPGVVEFRDGLTTIGVVPVNGNGTATMTTSNLAAGMRSLTARFFGGPVATGASAATVVHVVGTCLPAEPGNGAAVRLVYIELLRRCGDPGGYAYWKGQLENETVTREQFAAQISRSKEARMVIVDDAYQLMLGRDAEPDGRSYWADRLATNAGYDDLLAALADTPEFRNLAGGTNAGFVTRAYERILDTTPSASEVDFWVDYLERRGRKKVILAFFDQNGPLDAVITASYEEILDRTPTAEELAAARPAFKAGKDRSKLYASLIGTQEFYDRAQTFPELVS